MKTWVSIMPIEIFVLPFIIIISLIVGWNKGNINIRNNTQQHEIKSLFDFIIGDKN